MVSQEPSRHRSSEQAASPQHAHLWATHFTILRELGLPGFVTRHDQIQQGVGVVDDMTPQFLEVMGQFGKPTTREHYLNQNYVTLHGDEYAELFYRGDWQALQNPTEPQRIDEGPTADVIKMTVSPPGQEPAFTLGFFVIYEANEQRDPQNLDPKLKTALDRLAGAGLL